MSGPRLRPIRIFTAIWMRAVPGIAVVAILWVLGILTTPWALAAMTGCAVVAAFFALPAVRDMAALSAYADDLARDGQAPAPKLSDWAPASELAAAMRRIAAARRRARGPEGNVFDVLPQPLLLIGPDRKLVAMNGEARGALGRAPLGADLAVAIRDPDVLDAVDAVLAGAETQTVDFTIAGMVDRHFTAEVAGFDHPTAEGATALIALIDLTEHRRTERLRADFVANASHELRTPLATLVGFIETLRGAARDDEKAREEFLALMADSAGRMSRLVQDLLSLSRIELDEHNLPAMPVDLARVAGTVAGNLKMAAEAKDMKIAVRADDGVPRVAGDEDQLAQLIQNLIDNAIKYGRAGSEIVVRIARRDPAPPALEARAGQSAVSLSVTNEGEGIAPQHIPRLTERFYRVDAARSRAIGGTGLGLAIVKHIVTRHRGILEIASRPGETTAFTATFPAAGK